MNLAQLLAQVQREQWFFAKPRVDMSFSSIKERYWVCEGSDDKSQVRQLKASPGTSLAVHGLRLLASTVGGTHSSPGWGTEDPSCRVLQPEK